METHFAIRRQKASGRSGAANQFTEYVQSDA